MITSTLRATAALLAAIVLSVTLAGSPSLAARVVLITEVFVDFAASNVVITGENFDNLNPPTVFLGEFGELTVITSSPTKIVADCPLDPITSIPCPDGDYLLSVVTGPADKDFDAWDLTIGAVGPKGDKGDTGANGADGQSVISKALTVGNRNCPLGGTAFKSATGTTYACNGDKGEQGIQGIQGIQGVPGLGSDFSSRIYEVTVEKTPYFDAPSYHNVLARCHDTNDLVIGGGCFANNPNIRFSSYDGFVYYAGYFSTLVDGTRGFRCMYENRGTGSFDTFTIRIKASAICVAIP